MFFDVVDKLPLHPFKNFPGLSGISDEGHIELPAASGVSLGVSSVAEDINSKIKNYQPAPFDSHFPNQSQTGTAGGTT